MKYDLEKQRLQLEMERQLLNARVEVEQAQIEKRDRSQFFFLPRVTRIGRDKIRLCLPSLRKIFQGVTSLNDP